MVKEKENASYTSALVVLTTLFFMWGFITVLNDILSPYLKGVFALSHFQANLVQFAFFIAYFLGSVIYFILSITVGDPISRIGYKNGIILGLMVSAIACFSVLSCRNYISFVWSFSWRTCSCWGLALPYCK